MNNSNREDLDSQGRKMPTIASSVEWCRRHLPLEFYGLSTDVEEILQQWLSAESIADDHARLRRSLPVLGGAADRSRTPSRHSRRYDERTSMMSGTATYATELSANELLSAFDIRQRKQDLVVASS
jgi:hypothetical protein